MYIVVSPLLGVMHVIEDTETQGKAKDPKTSEGVGHEDLIGMKHGKHGNLLSVDVTLK